MAIRLSDQIVRRLTVGVDASYTNQPHPSYDLYVKGNTLHNGIIYVANGTTYYINNNADSRLRDVNVRTLGITQTDGDVGYGISLYGGPTTGGMATYGMSFAHTSKFGKIQNNNSVGVTSDWATYLTMSDTESRGWIFRRGSTNVAGIDGRGSFITVVSTGTHIKGLTGEAVAINMAAAAGYNMLARIKSSNGRFNIGVYNRCLDAIYGADSVTSNTYTHGIVLLAENGVTSLKYLRVDGANHVEEAFDMAGYIARFHGKTWVYGPLHIGRDDAAANTGYATANVGVNNYIAFYGIYGDNPGSFNHTYIGERIWGPKGTANEQSELLLFHGNDAAAGSGPDRIRAFAGAFKVDVFTTATSGAWMDVGNSANAIQGFYVHGTDGVILGNTTARSNGVNQTTINGHLVVNGAYNTNNSYSEGIRVNKSSNNWSVIQMGGATGSTTGTGDGQYLFGVNPSGYAYWSHNGSDSAASRIQGHKGNGWSIRPRLYVNTDAGTGYNFYVNGTSYFTGNVIMAATTESTSATTGTLRVDGGVGIGKDLNARSISRNGDNYILAPGGGYFTTTTSSYTGALKITMPVSWTNTMMDFFVDIYDYASQKLATYHIGGYNYASSANWVNTSAYCNGVGDKSNLTVRFCHDGSKCCITIGETNTAWSYPQVTIRGFSAKYSGTALSNWENGWSISFVTTLPTVKSTIENTALVQTDTANRMAYYSTTTHVKSAPNVYTDGSTYLAIINNNTNNSYDALLYVENQTASDWGMKIVKNTLNYGLYIQSTGNEQLRVGTNSIFVVHQKSVYIRPNNTEQVMVDENHTRVIARQAASNPYGGSGIEIREVGAVGTGQSALTYAPKLGFHWSGRYSAFIALHEHVFKFMADGGGSARPIVVGSVGSSWIDGHKLMVRAGISIMNINNTSSYWPWITAPNTGSAKLFSIGNLNNAIYLICSASSRTANGYDRALRWDGDICRLVFESSTTNQVIQMNTSSAECSIAYNGNSGNTNWVVGRINSNFGWWNGSYWVMTLQPVGRLWVGRDANDGERQIGVQHSTSGTLYMWANNGEKGLYSGAGYQTGYIIRITSNRVYFADAYNRTNTALAYSQAAIKMYKANIQDSNIGTGVVYYTAWNGYELRAVSQNYLLQRYDWWTSGNGRNVNNLRGGVTFAYTNHGSPPTTGTIVAFDCASNENYTLQIMGSYGAGRLYFRNRNGDNGSWGAWRQTATVAANTAAGDANNPIYINSSGEAVVTNRKLGAQNTNGYWGMGSPDNAFNVWIRTTNQGIIPYQSGGVGSGHQSLGTSSWFFSSAYADNIHGHCLYLEGATGATMTSGTTNPRIVFQEGTGTQPVVLAYTDYDSYRAPAGLKVVGGASATPAWFEVEGNMYVSASNTTGNGLYLADDGSIVDNNDGYCTMRFTYGVYITSGKNANTVRMGLRYDGWIYFYNSGNGLYWPNCNGAHLYANSGQGTYGALVTQGARNGYNGLHFGNNGNYMTVMDNNNDKGLFQQGVRWILWYNRTADRICIGGSNNSGWFINLNGNTYCYGAFYSGDVRGGRVRVVDNWVGFYQTANAAGSRYGYIQADGNRMYFRKENGASGNISFDFGSTIYCAGEVMAPTHMRVGATILRDDGSHFYFLVGTRNSPGNNWNSLRPFYFNLSNGYSYHTRAYSAVWNDYAEFRKGDTIEPGRCVIETKSGIMTMSTERLQPGAKIISDTYGQAMGETKDAKTPIAVSGRVLVYPYRDRKDYELGAAVCAAPNGTVDIMTREEIMMYPERIVGTVSEIPNYDIWHSGGSVHSGPSEEIKVNGRIWIYVR